MICLGDKCLRSYLVLMVKDENGLYHPPTKKLKFKKNLSWKNFAINCHGSHMGLTNRNHNKSSSTPSLNLAVVGCPSVLILLFCREAKFFPAKLPTRKVKPPTIALCGSIMPTMLTTLKNSRGSLSSEQTHI